MPGEPELEDDSGAGRSKPASKTRNAVKGRFEGFK